MRGPSRATNRRSQREPQTPGRQADRNTTPAGEPDFSPRGQVQDQRHGSIGPLPAVTDEPEVGTNVYAYGAPVAGATSLTASGAGYTAAAVVSSAGVVRSGGGSAPGLFHPGLYAWAPLHHRIPTGAGTNGAVAAPSRPLRIIHVGPSLARGGAEAQLIDLARFLDPSRARIERTIVVEPDGVDPNFAATLPIPYQIGGPEAVRRAARKCDVMLCWGVCLDDLLDDNHRPPLCVYVAHGEGAFTRERLERSLRHADHVVAVGEGVRKRACNGTPTTVIPNGIDSARLATTLPRDEVRRALGFGPDDFVVGYVGRFSPEKQPHLIVEAVAALPAPFKALMVGWGPLLPDLMARANHRIPGRHAFVTAADYLGDYYRALDAFCLVSREEGASLALVEAMMCGVPPIATPVGSVPELLVDRVNGLIVPPEAAAIRDAAALLHRHPHWAGASPRRPARPPTASVTPRGWPAVTKTSSSTSGPPASPRQLRPEPIRPDLRRPG